MTKKVTIKQRQEMYEYLLGLNCPDLLAALISKRADFYSPHHFDSIERIIESSFSWGDTPEGFEFWQMMHESVLEIESKGLGWLTHDSDYDLPVDLEHKMSKAIDDATLEMYTQHSKDILEPLTQGLSFWAKVKLFLGKWIYKV